MLICTLGNFINTFFFGTITGIAIGGTAFYFFFKKK